MPVRAVVLAVVISAGVALTATAVLEGNLSPNSWLRLAVLTGCGIAYEEASRTLGRAWDRIFSQNQVVSDMTAVWYVGAAIAVPPGWSSLIVVVLCAWQWHRQRRGEGMLLYRQAYTAAYLCLAVLAASSVAHLPLGPLDTVDDYVALLLVPCAAVCFHVVSMAGLVLAIRASGGPVTTVLRSDGLDVTELSSVCLGALAGVAALVAVPLVLLTVGPMYLLQRAALVTELEKAASTDSKTGLYNASTWQRMSERRLVRAIEGRQHSAVMIVDLDLFKSVNDAHGHLAGDHILRAVATALSKQMREGDILGRFGGEEFIAFFPSVDPLGLPAVAERLRAAVNALRLSDVIPDVGPAGDRALSASVGVAYYPQDGQELTPLIHAADLALYEAKNAGRNRAAFASPPRD